MNEVAKYAHTGKYLDTHQRINLIVNQPRHPLIKD